VRTRLAAFSDIRDAFAEFRPADTPAEPDPATAPVIHAAIDVLGAVTRWERGPLESALQEIARRAGVRGAALYVPLRRALTGRDHGPALPAVLRVQGKLDVLQRLTTVLAAAGPAGQAGAGE